MKPGLNENFIWNTRVPFANRLVFNDLKAHFHMIPLLFLLLPIQGLVGQVEKKPVKPGKPVPAEMLPDSTGMPADSLPAFSGTDVLPISKDALDAEVEYQAEDTIIMDYQNRIAYLYGNAEVKYTQLTLTADFIRIHLDSSIATATGLPDSSGNIVGDPVFKDGEESFVAKKMRYNFKTRKGMVYDVVAEQGDLYVLGDRTKIVSTRDSTEREDVIYNDGAIITTCNHPEPHYGIRARKIKTVPNKVAVVGPSNLEIMGVPTPLWLPFGFYPVTPPNKAGPGLIFPSDYEYSDRWGFGLREVGYYIPIREWADLRLTGDIYFNGSWGLNANMRYVKKYKFRGSVRLGFSSRITEQANSYLRDKVNSFTIQVSHNQDNKAHPYQRIGGSINIQSNNYQALNNNFAPDVLTNSFSSNFSYSRTFQDKPYSLNVGFSHSQNTRSNRVTINFPTVDFRLNRIYPFKSGKRVGKERWYEKIAYQYQGNAKTTFFATDSTIFSQMTLDDAQYGVQHRMSTDFNFDLFKYIHVTPSMNYQETWFFKTVDREFEFDPNDEDFVVLDTIQDPPFGEIINQDTINYGRTRDRYVGGFVPFRSFSAAISVNTQLFATKTWSKGWLRGIRHIIKPSISYNYSPRNYSDNYFRSVQTDIRDPLERDTFSIFQGGIYSASLQQVERQSISFSFNNIFEAKLWNKRDSTEKKLKLFDNIYVNGDYNFAADSFQFSRIGIRGTTRLFKGITTFSFQARYDPYGLRPDGRRSTEYYVKTDGKLLRFENLSLRFNSRLTLKQLRELFSPKKEVEQGGGNRQTQSQPRGAQSGQSGGLLTGMDDDFFALFDNFSVSHNFVVNRVGRIGKDTSIVSTHTINMSGRMKLTPGWSINVGNIGYDFRSKRLTYPDLGFTRDLHCWQLTFRWQPARGTYSLNIGVKPGSLDFLKVPYRRNNVDAFGGF